MDQTIHRQVESRLTKREVRYTRGRQRVVETLSMADGPRSATDLHQELGRVLPLSSLYRSLSVLTDAEVLATHHGNGRVVLYELAEWLLGHHHHRICEKCGAIADIELSGEEENLLERLVSNATRSQGFVATGHSLELVGVCATCQ